MAIKYVAPGTRPDTVVDWPVPAAAGSGGLPKLVADDQLDSLIVDVEYLIRYELAIPVLPSSPGAVQLMPMDPSNDPVDAFRLLIAAGGVMSVGSGSTAPHSPVPTVFERVRVSVPPARVHPTVNELLASLSPPWLVVRVKLLKSVLSENQPLASYRYVTTPDTRPPLSVVPLTTVCP